MASYGGSVASAFGQFQSGNLKEAERVCRGVLQEEPEQPDALHLLGIICHKLGKPDVAIDYLSQAVARNPSEPSFHNNFGAILQSLGKPVEAARCLRRAVALRPNVAEAHYNLGVALYEQGQLEEAVKSYQRALELNPKYAQAYNNLGMAYKKQERLQEAMECLTKAVQCEPRIAESYHNAALIYLGQGQVDRAIQLFQRALGLRPEYPEAHCDLGLAFQRQFKLDEATECFHQAVQLKPDYAEAHNNLGCVRMVQGELDEAIACFDEALRLDSEHVEAHWNRSLHRLLRGDFEQGWEEYEWRWKRKESRKPPFEQPRWDATPLARRTILLHAEQGLGDTMQFVRYAPLVKERGGFVVVQCQAPLVRLLSRSPGIDRLVAQGDSLPDFDCHIPLLGLPRIFKTSLANIPADIPYIFADPKLVEFWRGRLGKFDGLKIGICWQGNATFREDRYRSMPLVHFGALARLNGVRLFSLQKGFGTEQLRDLGDDFPIVDLGSDLDESSGAFMDTAAVMRNLDLVITSDTAIPHLAGALGVPVWVALSFVPDWRFLLDREDSPWYPTMRLFRQTKPGDWEGVFERITQTLRECVEHLPSPQQA